jgi:TolB protein
MNANILDLPLSGSLQNPAWSPDGTALSFTHFERGYNKAPANVGTLVLATHRIEWCARDGSENVSQPGSCWNAKGGIIFSSDRADQPDTIYRWRNGVEQLLNLPGRMAYEPTWAPNGIDFAFEAHPVGKSAGGRIGVMVEGELRWLTPEGEDCRQPCWSPNGKYLLYQRKLGRKWRLSLCRPDGGDHVEVKTEADATDATFSPDTKEILYSGEWQDIDAALLAIPVVGGKPRLIVGEEGRYFGAASWSPDGKTIACETCRGDPDRGRTQLALVPL